MPGCTLYKKIFTQLLLLCVCLAAASTCPNRKLIAAGTHTTIVQHADSRAESSHSVCSEGTSQAGFHATFKAGGNLSSAGAAIVFSLNLLISAPGTAFYLPPSLRSSLNADALPLFLKNGVLIV